MNKAKVSDENFIDFLAATLVNATAMEAQRTNPVGFGEPSHDAYSRLHQRLEPSSDSLWLEVKPEVQMGSGVLVLDDTVLDKAYARKMKLVHRNGKVRMTAWVCMPVNPSSQADLPWLFTGCCGWDFSKKLSRCGNFASVCIIALFFEEIVCFHVFAKFYKVIGLH